MFQIPALRIRQKGTTMFVTALPLSELKKHVRVDHFGPENQEGYQRPLVERRLKEVAKYVTKEEAILPTSVLLCVRDDDLHPPVFQLDGKAQGFAESGTLGIPEESTFWIADGQNRVFGVSWAYERNDATDLSDYPFPVTIMAGVDRYVEMKHFNIINTQQKKMPTDIVDRHLVMQAQREGLDMVAKGKEKDYQRARRTRITDDLNEQPGPWYHQIGIPGVAGKDKGLVRQHAMVVSLDPLSRDPLMTLTDTEAAELVARYWRAMEGVWPEAFSDLANHRVQGTAGLYALHMALPAVVQICLTEGGDFSEERMRQIWKDTGIDSNFWHKEHGDPLTLGTGMASIRALAQYFRDQLPKAKAVRI